MDRRMAGMAAEVGLDCRVSLAPEVWAACAAAVGTCDPSWAATAQAQAARRILASLAASLKKMRGGRLLFRSRLPRRQLLLVAEVEGDDPAIVVRLAGV